MSITAIALNCTLKAGDDTSSTDKLLEECLAELSNHGVKGEVVRVVNLNVKPRSEVERGRR